ncbi:unnamed protein product [Angiostrongylus costaricensis]|uniref:Secreted protein n=1 Tax=Angiostrongylus costaricensis TaxID=334426 RepID=A0A0R3P9G3_ANGCS|nr:unnamed protein product [Angiostrongylus costaricensis]
MSYNDALVFSLHSIYFILFDRSTLFLSLSFSSLVNRDHIHDRNTVYSHVKSLSLITVYDSDTIEPAYPGT